MPLPLSTRNPNLVARVGRSLERAREAAGLPPEDIHRLGGVGIDAVAAAAVRETDVHSFGTSLESIANPEQQAAFEWAFERSAQLYERIGLTPPPPEDFARAGIDFARLATNYEHEKTAGHEPEIIVTPNELPPESWQQLFQKLQDDPTVNVAGDIKSGGLYISDDISAHWEELNTLPSGVTTVERRQPATEPLSLDNLDRQWTIRIIPGTDRPTDASLDHDGRRNDTQAKVELAHPTIAEYLTLQGQSLQERRTPVDGETYTWLHGTFEGGSRAPGGDWYPDGGQVELSWRDSGGRYGGRGVRLAVW